MPTRWTLSITDASLAYTCKPHSGRDALEALIVGGVEANRECAELLGVAPGTVSKWAKKLHGAERIRISGNRYLPPEKKDATNEQCATE